MKQIIKITDKLYPDYVFWKEYTETEEGMFEIKYGTDGDFPCCEYCGSTDDNHVCKKEREVISLHDLSQLVGRIFMIGGIVIENITNENE